MPEMKKHVEAQIRQRFLSMMGVFTLEPKEFADKLSTGLQRILDLKRNAGAVQQDLLAALVEVFHVDGHWLLTGEGGPFKSTHEGTTGHGLDYERRMRFSPRELKDFSADQLRALFPRGIDADLASAPALSARPDPDEAHS